MEHCVEHDWNIKLGLVAGIRILTQAVFYNFGIFFFFSYFYTVRVGSVWTLHLVRISKQKKYHLPNPSDFLKTVLFEFKTVSIKDAQKKHEQ